MRVKRISIAAGLTLNKEVPRGFREATRREAELLATNEIEPEDIRAAYKHVCAGLSLPKSKAEE